MQGGCVWQVIHMMCVVIGERPGNCVCVREGNYNDNEQYVCVCV